MNAFAPSRRAFLQSATAGIGVFTLGSFLPPIGRVMAQGPAPGPIDPNIFLQISRDNTVTLISKHFEMGQGVTTGLATLVRYEDHGRGDVRARYPPPRHADGRRAASQRVRRDRYLFRCERSKEDR
jgi:isoquinoline 1-oxidoreductase beta subunit